MPTNKPRAMITMDEDLANAIEGYRIRNGISSTSQAVNELIRKGILAEDERLHNGGVYSGDEIRLVSIFRRADENSRQEVMDTLIHAVARSHYKYPRYKKEFEDFAAEEAIGDVLALIDLYRQASPEQRTAVLDILSRRPEEQGTEIEGDRLLGQHLNQILAKNEAEKKVE